MIFYECIRVQMPRSEARNFTDSPWLQVQKELDKLPSGQGSIITRIDQTGEVMVMLRWEQAQFDPAGSRLAQVLVSELQHHGLVSHSVWVEVGK